MLFIIIIVGLIILNFILLFRSINQTADSKKQKEEIEKKIKH